MTVARIASSGYSMCALLTSGTVKCWGFCRYGMCGYGASVSTCSTAGGACDKVTSPVDVQGLSRTTVSAIAKGNYHGCALLSDGSMKCWGRNNYGQLGDGTTTDRFATVSVQGLGGTVATINPGGWFTCARKRHSEVLGLQQLRSAGRRHGYPPHVTVRNRWDGDAIGAGHEHVCVLPRAAA